MGKAHDNGDDDGDKCARPHIIDTATAAQTTANHEAAMGKAYDNDDDDGDKCARPHIIDTAIATQIIAKP
jgi:hypothetical protein